MKTNKYIKLYKSNPSLITLSKMLCECEEVNDFDEIIDIVRDSEFEDLIPHLSPTLLSEIHVAKANKKPWENLHEYLYSCRHNGFLTDSLYKLGLL